MAQGSTVEEVAAKWSAEFGEYAAWFAAEKIQELDEWGDEAGAAKMALVLLLIESQSAHSELPPADITKMA